MLRLIIVDDEQGVRDMLADYVRQHEPQIEVAGCFSGGEAAFAFLQKEQVDMVITDIRMPRMSGLELARRIVEEKIDCVVLIVSGYGEFEYARQAIEYGVVSYLLKPIQMRELSDAISHMAQKLSERRANAIWESQFSDEVEELFFADLLMGKISEGPQLEARYQRLKLPYPHTQVHGFFLEVTVRRDKSFDWEYDTQRLFIAVGNVLRMQRHSCYVQPVGHQGDAFCFIVLQGPNNSAFDSRAIRRMLKEALGVTSELKTVACFESLCEAPELMRSLTRFIGGEGESEKEPQEVDRVIANAKAYIAAHYGEDITRYDVATAVYMNSAYFSRYFKAKTGENFNDYLIGFRMQRAIQLMNTGRKLSEICAQVGYSNYRYFARVFQQYTTYTPSEYRQKVIRNEDSFDDL